MKLLSEWFKLYPKFKPRRWMKPTWVTQQCGGIRWWECPKCKKLFPNVGGHHIKHAYIYIHSKQRKVVNT